MNRILVICGKKKREIFEEALFDFIKAGAELYFAEGEEAVELTVEKKPQVIFVDDQVNKEHLLFYQKVSHLVLLSDYLKGESPIMKKKQIKELCEQYLKLEPKSEKVPLL